MDISKRTLPTRFGDPARICPGNQLRGASSRDRAPSTPATADTRFARVLASLRAHLATRRGHLSVLALALFVSAPALWTGFESDDRFQVASLRSNARLEGIARAPWDLYSFAKDRASNIALREQGVWPWWVDTEVRTSFFRPLSSLSRWLDQTLWPGHLPLMQLHSFLWYALLLWIVAACYRRWSPSPAVAGLALALFSFDEARAAIIGWLCHRNTLIALVFGFTALLAHDRWRSQADRKAAWWGPACLALGLLGGETALQACGYLFAYALVLDRGSLRSRLGALAPYAGVLLVWGSCYKLLGYGSQGSAYYSDPVGDPLGFLMLLPERLAVYTAAQFEGISADWVDLHAYFGIEPRWVLVPLALAGTIAIGAALMPLYRREPLVRFWALGALLATVPVCSVRPAERMLAGTGLGGMALLAILLNSLVEKTYPQPRRWVIAFGSLLAVVNLALAPLLLPLSITWLDTFDQRLAQADLSIPRAAEIGRETLVLLNPPFDNFAMFLPIYRETQDIPRPKRLRWLTSGVWGLRVERTDAHTLKLAPNGGFFSLRSQQVLRRLDRPLQVGEKVALSDVTFEVTSLSADGRPKEVLARFAEPLEAASYRWMQWRDNGYIPFRPPAIGSAVTIPAISPFAVLLGV